DQYKEQVTALFNKITSDTTIPTCFYPYYPIDDSSVMDTKRPYAGQSNLLMLLVTTFEGKFIKNNPGSPRILLELTLSKWPALKDKQDFYSELSAELKVIINAFLNCASDYKKTYNKVFTTPAHVKDYIKLLDNLHQGILTIINTRNPKVDPKNVSSRVWLGYVIDVIEKAIHVYHAHQYNDLHPAHQPFLEMLQKFKANVSDLMKNTMLPIYDESGFLGQIREAMKVSDPHKHLLQTVDAPPRAAAKK
ncbi:MAG TPA: hypothetical protein VHZ76_06670, partial [Gammaproteobacteria bacterium]|nr:hypothetical protein [Gammaproteobacteria bacterium]